MTVVAVTGTDTEVGKTVVTAALAAVQLSLGRTVAIVKPAQTGIAGDEAGDLAEVRRLAGEVSLHEGVRLADPLAPDTAARVAGAGLPSLDEQQSLVGSVADEHDVTFVEGSGGLLVRLGEDYTLVDVVAPYDARWVVVARAGLGTLNHAELTVRALRDKGQHVAGLLVGSWPEHPGLAEEQNLLDLPRVTGVPLLGKVPAGAASLPVRAFRRGALDWVPDVVG
ncbi:MAG: dethiobiotin synthase [Marmoricola sp.]